MKGCIPVISTPSQSLEPSETCAVEDETLDQRIAEENSNIVENSSHHGHMVAKSVDLLDTWTQLLQITLSRWKIHLQVLMDQLKLCKRVHALINALNMIQSL